MPRSFRVSKTAAALSSSVELTATTDMWSHSTRLMRKFRWNATFRTVVDAYAAVGMTDLVVPWPRHDPPYAGTESILDQIAAHG